MKPINSKEKSKQLWQFVIIFFGLAVVPAALIFFSYYRVPEEISEAEERKLVNYSNFEHTQKLIIKKMSEVDSNISLYAAATTENPTLLSKKIVDGIDDLDKMDTSVKMIPIVKKGYENHYTHVMQLLKKQDDLKEALLKLEEAKANMKAAQSGAMMGMGNIPMPPPAQ